VAFESTKQGHLHIGPKFQRKRAPVCTSNATDADAGRNLPDQPETFVVPV